MACCRVVLPHGRDQLAFRTFGPRPTGPGVRTGRTAPGRAMGAVILGERNTATDHGSTPSSASRKGFVLLAGLLPMSPVWHGSWCPSVGLGDAGTQLRDRRVGQGGLGVPLLAARRWSQPPSRSRPSSGCSIAPMPRDLSPRTSALHSVRGSLLRSRSTTIVDRIHAA